MWGLSCVWFRVECLKELVNSVCHKEAEELLAPS